MSHYDNFLKLRCAQDVLDAVRPLNKEVKEVSEAMAATNCLRWTTMHPSRMFNLLDLCAGNAVGSVLAAHRFVFSSVTAIDKKPVRMAQKTSRVQRFNYVKMDIFSNDIYSYISSRTILIAIHACSDKAKRITEIWNKSDARFLVMIPCCVGKWSMSTKPFLLKKLGPYLSWCLHLAGEVNGSLTVDEKMVTPCNGIIRASHVNRKKP